LPTRITTRLEQGGYTDNPDQRLSEDLNNFTSDTLSLSLGLLRTVVSLVSFSVILWGVSGSIELFGITIPGYMFWAALIYAAVGSWLTHLIGRKLIVLSNQQQRYEADMRFSMVRIRENAESIALSDGEAERETVVLSGALRQWSGSNFWDIMKVSKAPDILHCRLFSDQRSSFPFVVASPRYLAGKIELGELMQISSAFGNVQENFSWFIECVPEPRILARHL
jgi:putative ATP-binding cassette transporter